MKRLGSLLLPVATLGLAACSLLLKTEDAQCNVTDDCTAMGFVGYTCAQNVCTKELDYCDTNQQCVDVAGGKLDQICDGVTHRCKEGCAPLVDGSKTASQVCQTAKNGPEWICKDTVCQVGCETDQNCSDSKKSPAWLCQAGICVEGCKTSQDCLTANPGKLTRCDASKCVDGCDTNQQCIDASLAASRSGYEICEKTTHKCMDLLSEEGQCTKVAIAGKADSAAVKLKALANDDTIVFGFAMDLRSGASNKDRGLERFNAAEMALAEIHALSGGIPGGTGGKARPLALVGCSETKDTTTAADPTIPAKYLAEKLKVSAMIGMSGSGSALKALPVTEPAGTLMFSPGNTSVPLSSHTTAPDLFWRTAPSDLYQAGAVAAILEGKVEAEAKTAAGNPAKVKMAVFIRNDSYGKGLWDNVPLKLNGASVNDVATNGTQCVDPAGNCAAGQQIFVSLYADTTTTANITTQATNVAANFKPNIVLVLATTADGIAVMTGTETGTPKPYYVLPETMAAATVAALGVANPTLNTRARGIRSKVSAKETAWTNKYNLAYPEKANPQFGAAGSYDIAYLFAYAALASGKAPTEQLTGADIYNGLKRVLGSPNDINDPNSFIVGDDATKGFPYAIGLIQAGKTTRMFGNSYDDAFKWDLVKGEIGANYSVWCINTANNGTVNSDMTYSPATGLITGDYTAKCQ